ncbi:MAG: AAA family ATPase [Desulfovibrionales bacterium]|nr:AAA family ATPase [Desulfovibrionales bacterium]
MTYYRYWGLNRPPFDNVPDPKMYWPQNPGLEDAISEILFAIKEGNECLAVIVGDIGTGKTLALRILLNELGPDKYKIAFLTNPTLSFTQIMREIIGQLENKKVVTKWKDHLQEEINQILYRTADEGKQVVIFIDEANVLNPASLQGLRLLTNMQDDRQNLVTFVLAGQKELAQKLERPSMENLYQRIGVYCKVRGLDSPELVAGYIAHRLKQVGCSREIFTEQAVRAIWKHSRGVPRVVNKICKLCLKAGETNQLQFIDETMVENLAYMFKKGFFKKDKANARKERPTEPEAHAPVYLQEESAENKRSEGVIPETQEEENIPSLESGAVYKAATLKDDSSSSGLLAVKSSGQGASSTQASSKEKEPVTAEHTAAVETDAERSVQTGGCAPAQLRPDAEDEGQTWPEIEDLIKHIPPEILNRLYAMEERQLYRLAGQLAASQLRENETLKNTADPIVQWEKMRSAIVMLLKKFSRLNQVGQATEYR